MTFRISDLDDKGILHLIECNLCKKKMAARNLIHHKTMCKKKRLYIKN